MSTLYPVAPVPGGLELMLLPAALNLAWAGCLLSRRVGGGELGAPRLGRLNMAATPLRCAQSLVGPQRVAVLDAVGGGALRGGAPPRPRSR